MTRNAKPALVILALAATACGRSPLSNEKAVAAIEGAAEFKAGKVLYLPRVLAIPAEGLGNTTAGREGEALNIIQIASVDPVVAVLRARDRVSIEDFVSAVPGSIVIPVPKTDSGSDTTAGKKDTTPKSPLDSARDARIADSIAKTGGDTAKPKPKPKPISLNEPHTSPPPVAPFAQAWVHTLRMTPRPALQGTELTADDGDDNPEAPRAAYVTAKPVGRTPGWVLMVASRELIRMVQVSAYTPTRNEPAGDARVDFLWRWHPTRPGTLFDTESAEFQSLPGEVQQAALTGGITLDASTVHSARATLARDGAGWKVTSVNWMFGDDKPHDHF
jgi:hypothetical protein